MNFHKKETEKNWVSGQTWAGLDGTRVWHGVLQGVRPAWGGDWHAGVVLEAVPSEHPEHGVTSYGQEGGPHTLDVLGVDAGVAHQHLGLPDHFVGPLLLVELGPVAVGHRVGSNLVAVGVEVLDLGVVRPLVGYVKCWLQVKKKGFINATSTMLTFVWKEVRKEVKMVILSLQHSLQKYDHFSFLFSWKWNIGLVKSCNEF